MQVKAATLSSRIDKSSKTRPTRSVLPLSHQSYLNPKPANLMLTKRINRALEFLLARRTYLLTVRTMLTSCNRNLFHRLMRNQKMSP